MVEMTELERQLAPGYTPPESAAPYKDQSWLESRDEAVMYTPGGRMFIGARLVAVNNENGTPIMPEEERIRRGSYPLSDFSEIQFLPPLRWYENSPDC